MPLLLQQVQGTHYHALSLFDIDLDHVAELVLSSCSMWIYSSLYSTYDMLLGVSLWSVLTLKKERVVLSVLGSRVYTYIIWMFGA